MSDFRIFVGDQAMPMDGTVMELDITHEIPALGASEVVIEWSR